LGRSLCQIHLAGRVNVQIMHRYTRILTINTSCLLQHKISAMRSAMHDGPSLRFLHMPYLA
jgi:hypothetical protein